MPTSPRLKYLGLSLLLVLASINFTRTTLEIIKSSKRLDDIKNEISALEQQKKDLTQSIEYKNSEEFIEKTAREELNMIKPGESVYVIKGLTDAFGTGKGSPKILPSELVRVSKAKTLADRVGNLKLWWKFLF